MQALECELRRQAEVTRIAAKEAVRTAPATLDGRAIANLLDVLIEYETSQVQSIDDPHAIRRAMLLDILERLHRYGK